MDFSLVNRHVHALELARECARLGARARTIAYITGLPKGEVARFLFDQGEASTSGKTPYCPRWMYRCTLVEQVEASVIVAVYCRMRGCGINAADALAAAFKLYAAHFESRSCSGADIRAHATRRPKVNFDRAFDLVCHVDGIWAANQRSLGLVGCDECGCDFVTTPALPTMARTVCPFCRLLKRFPHDRRYVELFPMRAMPRLEDVSLGLLSRLIEKEK